MTTSRRTRLRIFRVAAVLGATVVALLIGELLTTLSGVNDDFRFPMTSTIIPRASGPFELSQSGFVPYATIRTEYATDPRDYFDSGRGVDHVFNSEGWRDDEHSEVPEPGTYRILALGDSYLMGQGVKRQDLWLRHLEELLNERFPESPIETINTGQAAYNTAMELQLLKQRGLDYQPHLVLLSFVPNDVEPDVFTEEPKVEFLTEYTGSYTSEDWLTPHSDLWTLVKRKLAMQFISRRHLHDSIASYHDDSQKWTQCRDALLEVRQTCQDNDVALAVVVWPFFVDLDGNYPFQPIHDQVTSTCDEHGIPVLDLRDVFGDFSGPELWVHPTDQHPNEIAHKMAAQAIEQFVFEVISQDVPLSVSTTR